MRVEFLGTGGFHPNERRHTACVMFPEIGLVFDAGTSAFRIPPRLQTDALRIFLSHSHLDHVAGLTFLLTPMLMGNLAIELIGNAKTLAAVRTHILDRAIFPIEPPYQYTELEEKMSIADDGVLTHTGLKHPGGSIGYRIDWPDRSIAYITDTTVDGSYDDFVQGVDVLIHECYFDDAMAEWGPKTGHSHTTPVVQLARAAGVQRLYLVHIDPQRPDDDPIGIETARAIFPETEVAEDGLVIEF